MKTYRAILLTIQVLLLVFLSVKVTQFIDKYHIVEEIKKEFRVIRRQQQQEAKAIQDMWMQNMAMHRDVDSAIVYIFQWRQDKIDKERNRGRRKYRRGRR